MKASDFKHLIKEAVREAIREELQAIQQPVQQSQAPTPQAPAPAPAMKFTGNNPLAEALNMTSRAMTSEDYRNMGTANTSMSQMFDRSMFMPKQSMTPASTEPAAVAAAVASAPKVGLDISQLSFINKAAAIVKEADRKASGR